MLHVTLFALIAAVQGLRLPVVARPYAIAARSPLAFMGVKEMAQTCLDEECSLDTIDDLIATLQVEADKLTKAGSSKEQVEVLLMLGRLQALNQNPESNKSEIEKIVSAAARTFGTVEAYDFPGEALGYTGSPNRAKVGLD